MAQTTSLLALARICALYVKHGSMESTAPCHDYVSRFPPDTKMPTVCMLDIISNPRSNGATEKAWSGIDSLTQEITRTEWKDFVPPVIKGALLNKNGHGSLSI